MHSIWFHAEPLGKGCSQRRGMGVAVQRPTSVAVCSPEDRRDSNPHLVHRESAEARP